MFRQALTLSLALAAFTAQAAALRVMSYNVENLFDADHDTGKDDWTFLPMNTPGKFEECEKVREDYYKKTCHETDWTADKLQIKLAHIEQVVKSSGAGLPDILAMVEVENANVVEMVRRKTGHQRMLITNSPDARGVDVAVLFNEGANLRFVSSKEHQLKTSRFGITSPTRNILEVNFALPGGKTLSLFVNHWPSQQSGPNSRNSAAQQLVEILKPRLRDPNAKVMLIGDFNVVDAESPNPFVDTLTKGTGLVDIYTQLNPAQKAKLPAGTYFYTWDFSWNRLDRVVVNQGFLKGKPSVAPGNLSVFHPSFISKEFEQKNPERPHLGEKAIIPWSYWHNAYTADRAGYSDHYPIQVTIDL